MELSVEMEGGRVQRILCDQRDYVAWEGAPRGFPVTVDAIVSPSLGMLRYIAWHAMRRQDLTGMTYEKWSESCVEVRLIVEEAAPAADADDPGQPEANDASGSSSRSTRASRSRKS